MDGSQDNEVKRVPIDPKVYPGGCVACNEGWCDEHAVAPSPEPEPALPPPSPIDDFERRLKLCHEHGVRALKDGQLEVVFSPPPRKQTPEEAGLSAFVMAEAAANMKAGE